MKGTIAILATALCIALVSAHPLPRDERLKSDALDRLVMVEADNETALRSKRTIGILRQLFPGISQMIEQKVNAITAELFRVLGPVVIRTFLGGGGGGGLNTASRTGGGSNGGATASAAPPFGDDDDEDTDDDDDELKSTSANGSKVSISFPTFPPDEEEEDEQQREEAMVASSIVPTTTESSTSPGTTETATNTVADNGQTETAAGTTSNPVTIA